MFLVILPPTQGSNLEIESCALHQRSQPAASFIIIIIFSKRGYLLLLQRVASGIYQRRAGGGRSEGCAAETGHGGIPSDRRDIRQLAGGGGGKRKTASEIQLKTQNA